MNENMTVYRFMLRMNVRSVKLLTCKKKTPRKSWTIISTYICPYKRPLINTLHDLHRNPLRRIHIEIFYNCNNNNSLQGNFKKSCGRNYPKMIDLFRRVAASNMSHAPHEPCLGMSVLIRINVAFQNEENGKSVEGQGAVAPPRTKMSALRAEMESS